LTMENRSTLTIPYRSATMSITNTTDSEQDRSCEYPLNRSLRLQVYYNLGHRSEVQGRCVTVGLQKGRKVINVA